MTVILIVSILFFALILVVYFQPLFLVKLIAKQSTDVLYLVPTESKLIALTIDDGPHATVTPKILDVLQKYSSQATFFLIGDRISGNEHILERMRSEGHELGNHLAKDYPSILLSSKEFAKQLVDVDKLIRPSGKTKWFRPGSGWYNKRMLGQIHAYDYKCALASIYPHDTVISNPTIVATYILRKVFPGGIVVIHDGTEERLKTVEVLHRILPILKAKGYKVLTLSELLSTAERSHRSS